MQKPAKIDPQPPPNEQDSDASGQFFVLEWRYRQTYETLHALVYGGGLRPEFARLLKEIDPHAEEEPAPSFEHKTPVPAEPPLFQTLLRANVPRTVRQIVNKSQCLRASYLGAFLLEQPERLLKLKQNSRFPKTCDKQIEFLARDLASPMAGYEPNTGMRYLSKISRCHYCQDRPAVMTLNRDGKDRPWCGNC
jgi:hypothetical protein